MRFTKTASQELALRDPVADSEECSTDEDSSSPEDVDWASVGLKVLLLVLGFLVLVVLLEVFASEEVTACSKWLMQRLGLEGLFLAVFFADGVPQPFTYVPLIFMAVKAEKPLLVVFGVCAAASYCAAMFGYAVGWNMRRLEYTEQVMEGLKAKYPAVPNLMETRGAFGVALAALLPVPLAIATWTAGSFRIFLPYFMLAATMRAPKIGVFVLLSSFKHEAHPHHS